MDKDVQNLISTLVKKVTDANSDIQGPRVPVDSQSQYNQTLIEKRSSIKRSTSFFTLHW